MTKRHIKARRERNRELGEREYQHRCAHCKTVLESVRIQMGERFCSTECSDDHETFQERWAAARAKVSR